MEFSYKLWNGGVLKNIWGEAPAPIFNAIENTDLLSLPNLDQYVVKSKFFNCASMVQLAIAEDSGL